MDQDQRVESGTARDAVREMIDAGLLDRLMAWVDADGLALTGEGGFLPEMVKAVLERGLQAELTDHLGYEKGDPAGRARFPHPSAHMIGAVALWLVQANFKARDDSALGRFWAQALDWGVSSEGPGVTNVAPVGFVWPNPAAFCVDVVAVPDPETVKYRVHLDLATTSAAHQTELVTRLAELGATPADVGQGDVPWTVLADPEGNVFCVLEPREIYRDTGPIAAVVMDCTDPPAMARFWGEAVDWTLHEVTDDHARLRSAQGVGPYLEFLRTPGVKAWWNRVHLDVAPYPGDDQEVEVTRLRVLGATDADVGQGNVPWKVLADPEGNEFCVLALR